jgi:hypothetical protein
VNAGEWALSQKGWERIRDALTSSNVGALNHYYLPLVLRCPQNCCLTITMGSVSLCVALLAGFFFGEPTKMPTGMKTEVQDTCRYNRYSLVLTVAH